MPEEGICLATWTLNTLLNCSCYRTQQLLFREEQPLSEQGRIRLLCAAEYCVAPPPPCLPTIATSVAQQKGSLGQVTMPKKPCQTFPAVRLPHAPLLGQMNLHVSTLPYPGTLLLQVWPCRLCQDCYLHVCTELCGHELPTFACHNRRPGT